MNERDKRINNRSIYETGIMKAIEIVMGWKIPHPTNCDSSTRNRILNEILHELKKQNK